MCPLIHIRPPPLRLLSLVSAARLASSARLVCSPRLLASRLLGSPRLLGCSPRLCSAARSGCSPRLLASVARLVSASLLTSSSAPLCSPAGSPASAHLLRCSPSRFACSAACLLASPARLASMTPARLASSRSLAASRLASPPHRLADTARRPLSCLWGGVRDAQRFQGIWSLFVFLKLLTQPSG